MAAQAQAHVKARGSREEVWSGLARATSGGLVLADLKKNARGAIVSIKQSEAAKARYPALKAKLCATAAVPAVAAEPAPAVAAEPAPAVVPAVAAEPAPAVVPAPAATAIEAALEFQQPAEYVAPQYEGPCAGSIAYSAGLRYRDDGCRDDRHRAIQDSFVADFVALTADPIINVAPRAAAATNRISLADRQTISQIVADLEAIKLAHKQHYRPAVNLARYQRALDGIRRRLYDTVKSKAFRHHFRNIESTLYPEDRPSECNPPFYRLKELHKYRTVNLSCNAGPDDC